MSADYWEQTVVCSFRAAHVLARIDNRLVAPPPEDTSNVGGVVKQWVARLVEWSPGFFYREQQADFVEQLGVALVRALDDVEFRDALIAACMINQVPEFLRRQQ